MDDISSETQPGTDPFVNWSLFGLSENPFALTPEPRYFYLSRTHEQGLSGLVYGLAKERNLMTLIGPPGSGKTILCHTLLSQFGEDINSTVVEASYLQGKDLTDAFVTCSGKIHKSVLVVDNAEDLSGFHLRLMARLSDLGQQGGKTLHIILAGRPVLKARLIQAFGSPLPEHMSGITTLKPLSKEETAAYIRYRLKIAAEGVEQVRFSFAAFQVIWHLSRGCPRTLNLICGRALRRASAYMNGEKIAKLKKDSKNGRGDRERHFIPHVTVRALFGKT